MTVSLFNHLCCFTLRTDGFGNLPSGGRTKTRKTIQAGRFQNEKRIKKQILTHEITMWRCMYQRPTDERIRVCAILELHSSSRRGRSGFGGFGVMSAVPPPFWRKSVTGQLVVLDSLFPDLEELQVWAASIHTFPFKELLLLRRFKYPASQPLANCDIVLHRLANFDFACKAAMGSGRNEMSIDRGKFYLHSFANTSLKTCHHPWMNHSDIVQEKSLNMASWHTSAWELLLGLLAKRQVKRPPMISPQGIFGHFPLRPFRSFRSCHAKMHKNAAPRSWPVRWT